MHTFCKLLPLTILLFAPGCIPFAYIKPDVDIYHATLPELQNEAVAVLEVKETFSPGKPPLLETSVESIDASSSRVTRLAAGRETGIGVLGYYHVHTEFDSQLKAYRRGYQTRSLSSGLHSLEDSWERCQSLAAQETAIDSLTRIEPPQAPLKPREFPTPDELKAVQPAVRLQREMSFSDETLKFLIAEYEHLASLAKSSEEEQHAKNRLLAKAGRLRQLIKNAKASH